MRLLGNSNISAALGTRQELEFVIAIDSDGSKLQQSSVLNMVTFTFDNLINATSLQLMESNEFQHYTYTFPPVDNSSVGIYALAFGEKFIILVSCEAVKHFISQLHVQLYTNACFKLIYICTMFSFTQDTYISQITYVPCYRILCSGKI